MWQSIELGMETMRREVDLPPVSGGGSGRSLPPALLWTATASALFSTFFSLYSINSQLRAYRKPVLQRYVVRLLLMVPIYSLSSMASLFSLQAAFIIDVLRDVYEGFVIWSFFSLLVEYLGGERSLLILVHGRKPIPHPFPINLFFNQLDISDPYTFLGLKRGILQYVQIKPILAILTVVLKSLGKYDDGKLAWDNGYTWVSVTYNFSVFLSLYCLGMFWAGLAEDLAPFRVTSKFLCIKGIIFFSFWQGFGVSILVATGLIKQIGPVRDEEFISLAVQDMLICLEMPLFALGHAYAFSPRDYIDPFSSYQSRLPALYALRDAIGMYDVISDSLTTIRGTGYGYQTFEPSEGVMHQRLGRERRVRAGLRYTQGGKAKYWLPLRGTPEEVRENAGLMARHQGPAKQFRRWLDKKRAEREGYAPLLPEEAEEIVHEADVEADAADSANHSDISVHDPLRGKQNANYGSNEGAEDDHASTSQSTSLLDKARQWAVDHAQASLDFLDNMDKDGDEDVHAAALNFSDIEEGDEMEILYEKSRALAHGDYAFPSVDIREEEARKRRWEEDENMLKRYKAQKGQRMRVGRILGGGGKDNKKDDSEDNDNGGGERSGSGSSSPTSTKPVGVVDILVADSQAEERERLRERRRGDPALRAGQRTRIFRREWEGEQSLQKNGKRPSMEAEESPNEDGKKLALGRSENEIGDRIKSDAVREQHPQADDGTSHRIEDSDLQPKSHADVETAEVGEEGVISHVVDVPGSPEQQRKD
jgi:Organic solute transporter Ostalpha